MQSFFQRDVLDEILDLIESFSEGFPTFSYIISNQFHLFRMTIGGWSGGAMVLGKLTVPGRPPIWIQ